MKLQYEEKVSSRTTQTIFVALVLFFGAIAFGLIKTTGLNGLTITTIVFIHVFLFSVLNYKILIIRISEEKLNLRFGIFSWTVSLENVAVCELDNNLPPLMKYGGAGIHFMMVHGRYRVSFNFLEYERVVIRLKEKQGLVRDVSFSTRHPVEIMNILQRY